MKIENMRKKKENIFYLSKLYNWTILVVEGVGVAILNGCCHNNLECRKICALPKRFKRRRTLFNVFDSSRNWLDFQGLDHYSNYIKFHVLKYSDKAKSFSRKRLNFNAKVIYYSLNVLLLRGRIFRISFNALSY